MNPSDPLLAEAARIVAEIRARGRLAVVAGGAVRDSALGRPVTDVDIATDMPLDELGALFRTHEVGRSKQFETVVVARGGHAFEITRLRGGAGGAPPGGRARAGTQEGSESGAPAGALAAAPGPSAADALREDAAHRDFTINAMFLDAEGRVVDHHGGLEDLRARLVRAVGDPAERFAEDPARLLRAVRFAATLGFEIEEATAEATRAGAGALASVAGERIGAEVLKMATAPGAALARGVELMDRLGLLRTVLPEVADLQGLEQPAEWHPEGDAWQHTLAALRCSRSPDPAVNLAVLLHDIGKRPAHFVENGRHRYHGHEKAGLALVEAVARRLFLPQRLRAAVLFAVEQHGKCGRMDEMRRSKRLALVASEHWPVLRALVLCDIGARGLPAVVERAEEVFGEAERDAVEHAERGGGVPVVTGTRVMELTGLAPGPRVGEIQRRVSEWALDNRVEDPAAIDAKVAEALRRLEEGGESK